MNNQDRIATKKRILQLSQKDKYKLPVLDYSDIEIWGYDSNVDSTLIEALDNDELAVGDARGMPVCGIETVWTSANASSMRLLLWPCCGIYMILLNVIPT